jgi:hypothetical protein
MINLTDEMRAAINNALADNYPTMWTSVDESGQPSSAFFGSAQVMSDHEIGIWMKTPSRGFLARIAHNDKVSMLYRNHATKFGFQIQGEARRVDDEETKRRVYDAAPVAEQNGDPDRIGTAVVVDIVRVIQRGEIVQARDELVGAKVD